MNLGQSTAGPLGLYYVIAVGAALCNVKNLNFRKVGGSRYGKVKRKPGCHRHLLHR